MKKLVLLLGLVLGFGLSNLALAVTLDEAKAQGLVGEKLDGYVGAVVANPPADVQAMITTTNDGRRKVYADVAQRNGISVEEVGILAAEKLFDNAKSGEFLQMTSGQWEKKP